MILFINVESPSDNSVFEISGLYSGSKDTGRNAVWAGCICETKEGETEIYHFRRGDQSGAAEVDLLQEFVYLRQSQPEQISAGQCWQLGSQEILQLAEVRSPQSVQRQ